MFEKVKERLRHASKETIKEELSKHSSELFGAATVVLLLYLCVKVNGKPVNITVNVNGGAPFV